jgi:hypothetical protein
MNCAWSARIDAHFERRTGVEEERLMREHVTTCVACRERYRRWLLYEKLALPEEARAERLAAPFGVRLSRRAWLPRLLVPSLALAAGLAGLVALVPREAAESEFRPRGGGSTNQHGSLELYRVAGGRSVRCEGELHRGESLAFTYSNPSQQRYLMVFVTDEHSRVYWLAPVWSVPSETPRAVAISGSATPTEFRQATQHDFLGTQLRVRALFLDEPLTVREVEALLSHGERLPGTEFTRSVKVLP